MDFRVSSIKTDYSFKLFLSFTELPKEARLDDMANLLNLDSKNLDVKQLGIDAIKDQHRISQQLSSNQCAILPEHPAQIMLTGVSNLFLL